MIGSSATAVLIERTAMEAAGQRLAAGERCEIVRLLVVYLASGHAPFAATATVIHHGRTLGLAEVWLRDPDGTPVAKGVVTYRLEQSNGSG